MSMRARYERIGAALGALVVACALSGAAAAQEPLGYRVLAQQSSSNPFSALVGERRERRADARNGEVERYVLASDNRAFLIEARSRTARLKFLCGPNDERLDCALDPQSPAPEIYLATVTRGPRGDLIFKNADGETLLRIASYGGATVFWPGETQGSAASKSFGDDRTIELVDADRETVERRAKSATAIVSALSGAPITFDIAPPLEEEAGKETGGHAVLADAIVRVAIGVSTVADDPTGAEAIGKRIKRILFQNGQTPDLFFEDDLLIVRYVPGRDIAGRPSSRAVERFLEETL